MRDVTIAKSEYYSNEVYYNNNSLNNYYLSHYDTSFRLFEIDHTKDGAGDASQEYRQAGTTKERVKTGADTSGGVNYSVDERGSIHLIETEMALSDLEKIGPSANMGTERRRN